MQIELKHCFLFDYEMNIVICSVNLACLTRNRAEMETLFICVICIVD